MQHELHTRFARERLRDDHAGAAAPAEQLYVPPPRPITIRPLADGDVAAVERLAAHGGRPVPPGPLLLAEVEGHVAAALALVGGETLAEPSEPAEEALPLLSARAEQLRRT